MRALPAVAAALVVTLVSVGGVPSPAPTLAAVHAGRVLTQTSPSPTPVLAPETTTAVVRLSGVDRVRTAVEVSRSRFSTGTPVAFVTTPDLWPDALAAGPAAGFEGAPILLAGRTLPPPTADELARLDPDLIIVVGGPAAVSNETRQEIIRRHPDALVRPLSGRSRFDTAVQVSRATFRPGAPVTIATGADFPDALAGGPAAGGDQGPILLVEHDRIPGIVVEELERLRPPRITVLGGTAAVSDDVARQLRDVTGAPVTRVAGPSRWETSARIVATAFPAPADTVFVASGEEFPDALAGVPVATMARSPVLLVARDAIPPPTADQLRRLNPRRIVILGGTARVSQRVEQELTRYLRR